MSKRHDCNVPNTSAKTWRCHCGRTWTLTDVVSGTVADLWHGKDNIRNADGSKIKGFWSW